ncbi:starch phosphorylase [Alkalicoccobacillus murimartini]|uniref:Alpha-1,4 glucan phosphorylase n=1 Tax=Alkalicoccobacillus murimartini TaxID=171685 RepID=A0ABT9YBQ7_9BACI|nr:starch phosphorylase [Alkalicoccobacillus murimartini]
MSKKLLHAGPLQHDEVLVLLTSLIKDQLLPHTRDAKPDTSQKQVYYFSMEFLPGRFIETNLLNLDLLESCKEILRAHHYNPDLIFQSELDAALGNGGLGRLASCFLDSLAALDFAGHGMGLRYQYGLFEQKISNSKQVELPDKWIGEDGYPWEEIYSEEAVTIQFGGRLVSGYKDNRLTFDVIGPERIKAIPYQIPILGYHNQRVNYLTVWQAESIPGQQPVEFEAYAKVKRKAEEITEFLYPDDSHYEGKVLRLRQQYFLVSAGLQRILTSFFKSDDHQIFDLPDKLSIQINDTHPALIIPELMRVLVDNYKLGWEEAWNLTTSVISYTNHTLLDEALEKWPVFLVKEQLPRIFLIIEEINRRFCLEVEYKGLEDWESFADLSIIYQENIHMARLAVVGSHTVNGVAKLHSSILKNQLMKSFSTHFPNRFTNKTNGISHRQWLMNANPLLARFISELIGDQWKTDPQALKDLLKFTNDPDVLLQLSAIKHANKIRLVDKIKAETGHDIFVESLFDVQIKRLHGYKRQLLNLLHILYLWDVCHEKPEAIKVPRTFIFGAKAAPGYLYAKRIISLISSVAEQINQDPLAKGKLNVLFLPNYNVSQAEWIIPAADISEQISTASKEASGTGNMKMMMNGALTIGTMDGANIEMTELITTEHFFEFGIRAEEVLAYERNGQYSPREIYNQDLRLQKVLQRLVDGSITGDTVAFQDIYYSLLFKGDEYFLLKDFGSYVNVQNQVQNQFLDSQTWQKKCLINIAHSGYFSSDRTISEYATDIWGLVP